MHPPVEILSVEAELERLSSTYDVRYVVYDPTNFRRSAEVLEGKGLPMMEFQQSSQRMADASASLLRLVQEKKLCHSGDPAFRAHVLAGTAKTYERGWRLHKDPRTRRSVGALVALAMAAHIAQDSAPKAYWAL